MTSNSERRPASLSLEDLGDEGEARVIPDELSTAE